MKPDDPDISHILLELFDHSAEAMLVVDTEGRILYANEAAATFGGRSVAEIQGKLLWPTFPDLSKTHYEQEFRRAVQQQIPVTIENYFPPADKWFEVRFYPSRGVVAVFATDITERKTQTEAIRVSEEKYRMLLNTVDQGFCVCELLRDADGNPIDYRFLEVNPVFERMTGLADAGGKTIKEMVPDLEDWWIMRYAEVMQSGKAARFQNGSVAMGRMFDVFATPAGGDRFVVLFTDITDRERREQENEALTVRLRRAMQETHHRVKNNLQIIAALVEMQSFDAESEANAAPLHRINQHIQALAVIHDLLTKNSKEDVDLSHLGTRAVLNTLIPLLQNTIGQRRIVSNIDDVSLTAEKAASLALLVSECVSNAVKHGRDGVEITLRNEGDTARLEVCDDGGGFPPDFDPKRAANTGLQLIESAARWDLRGEVRYDNHAAGGGRVTVIFPLT